MPPSLWVVVDDGSTDDTAAILDEYARRLPYLRVVRRADRGRRQVGPGVIEAFYAGLETVRLEDFDYLCKLDMDLDLPRPLLRAADGADGARSARWDHLGQAMVRPPAERRTGAGGLRRRDVGGHDQVLPGRLLQGDRRLRAPGHVGWHRLPPRPHARLDRRERRSRAHPLRSPASAGRQPEGNLDRAASGRASASTSWARRRSTTWPWPSIACRLTRCSSAASAMLWGYLGSWLKGLPRYDEPRVQALPARLPARLPAHGQASCYAPR